MRKFDSLRYNSVIELLMGTASRLRDNISDLSKYVDLTILLMFSSGLNA